MTLQEEHELVTIAACRGQKRTKNNVACAARSFQKKYIIMCIHQAFWEKISRSKNSSYISPQQHLNFLVRKTCELDVAMRLLWCYRAMLRGWPLFLLFKNDFVLLSIIQKTVSTSATGKKCNKSWWIHNTNSHQVILRWRVTWSSVNNENMLWWFTQNCFMNQVQDELRARV